MNVRTFVGASVNCYLVLRSATQVLLLLRQNTGWGDGMYGLIAGHVEEHEPASLGMEREALEEAGIKPSNLRVAHISHRKTNRLNVDIFFECDRYQGKIENCEPSKCAALEYHPLNNLPSNTLPHIKNALNNISKGIFYSEEGWEC